MYFNSFSFVNEPVTIISVLIKHKSDFLCCLHICCKYKLVQEIHFNLNAK